MNCSLTILHDVATICSATVIIVFLFYPKIIHGQNTIPLNSLLVCRLKRLPDIMAR